MKTTFLMLLMWITGIAFGQQTLTGKVVEIIDGNTFQFVDANQDRYKVSLFGIDCPELGQEYADKAGKALEKMLLNKTIKLELKGKDRWGNYLGVAIADNKDSRIELLEEGLAWTSEKNPIQELEEHRIKAQEKGRGLWKQENPTPPWIYRRQQSMMQAKTSY